MSAKPSRPSLTAFELELVLVRSASLGNLVDSSASRAAMPVRAALPKPARGKLLITKFGESSFSALLFALVTATLFLRPAEMIPQLVGLPIYEGLILSTLVFSIFKVQAHFRMRSLRVQPVSLCVLGILLAIALSHLSHFYLYGVYDSGTLFFKTVVYFALLVSIVDSPARLRGLAMATAFFGSLMVSLCVIDYVGWHDFEFIKHLDTREGEDLSGELLQVFRMRGTGIFEDPNDISQIIAVCSILCLFFLNDKRNRGFRWFWLIPLIFLFTGLVFTRSRGGLLSLAAAMLTAVLFRYGKKTAFAAGLVGIVALPLIGGRQSSIGLEEDDTGHERITLWRDGLECLQSPDLLFGIGQGFYADVAGLVAHNSFIHAFVELGLFGGTFFFGCFFFIILGLFRLKNEKHLILDPELARMYPYILGVVAGWCMGMLSLSRCYVAPTYLVVGLGASFVTLAGRLRLKPRPLVWWDRNQIFLLLCASGVTFAFFFAVVKVFA